MDRFTLEHNYFVVQKFLLGLAGLVYFPISSCFVTKTYNVTIMCLSTLHRSTLYLEPGFLKPEPGDAFSKLHPE